MWQKGKINIGGGSGQFVAGTVTAETNVPMTINCGFRPKYIGYCTKKDNTTTNSSGCLYNPNDSEHYAYTVVNNTTNKYIIPTTTGMKIIEVTDTGFSIAAPVSTYNTTVIYYFAATD